MSKVKNYMDSNKEKARHRNRINETRRTKANRIRKCKNGTYSFFGADTIMKLNMSPIDMSIYITYT